MLSASLRASCSSSCDKEDLESRRARLPRGRKMEEAEGLELSLFVEGMMVQSGGLSATGLQK